MQRASAFFFPSCPHKLCAAAVLGFIDAEIELCSHILDFWFLDLVFADRELAMIGRKPGRLAAVSFLIKIFGSQAVWSVAVIGLVPLGYKNKTLGCKNYPFTSRSLIVAIVASMAIWLYFVASLILQHNPNV